MADMDETVNVDGVDYLISGYLQVRAASLPAFNNHKLGKNRALDDALRSLVDSGYLREVKPHTLVEQYNFHGKAFRILRLPD